MTEKEKNTQDLTFEQAIEELTAIVKKIEQGQIELQDSLDQYERGMKLITCCKNILESAEKQIEQINKTEPPDTQED